MRHSAISHIKGLENIYYIMMWADRMFDCSSDVCLLSKPRNPSFISISYGQHLSVMDVNSVQYHRFSWLICTQQRFSPLKPSVACIFLWSLTATTCQYWPLFYMEASHGNTCSTWFRQVTAISNPRYRLFQT